MKNFKKSAKFLSILLSVCMLLSFMPMVALAEGEEETTNFNITVNEDGTTCTVTGFKADCMPTADGYELTIPETIDGYTVTAIGENAFHYKVGTYMDYMPGVVTFPDTLKTIGKYSFGYCKSMTISKWPDSLEVIKESAFNNAQKCTKVTGDFTNTKLTTIEKLAFGNAPGLLRINGVNAAKFPDTLTTVGEQAFAWLTIKNFVFPDSVTTMSDKTLQTWYGGLESVRFPRNASFTSIPAGTLSSSYPLRSDRMASKGKNLSLYIPETITTIPDTLLKDMGDGTTAVIYGKYGSAAWDFYNMVKAGLEAGTYTNDAVYPHIEYKSDGTTVSWQNPEDIDKDGKGEMASISFVEYDFDLNAPILLDDNGIFNGENNIDIVNGTGNASPAVKTTEGGVFGKAESDLAYKLELNGDNHTGFNYYEAYGRTLDTSILEISMAKPAESIASICITAAFYKTAEVADNVTIDGTSVSNRYSGSIIDFKADGIYIGDNPAFKSEDKYTLLCKAQPEQWVTVAVIIPGSNDYSGGSDEVYVYINGTCYPIELIAPIYGTRHLRAAPTGKFEEPQVIYYDNIREYAKKDETYIPDKDKPASVEFSNFEVEDNEVIIPGEMSVSVFKRFIKTDGFLRMYTDSSCKTELTDSDTAQAGNVVVVSTKNKRTTERVYTYYTLKEEVVELIEEPGIYNGNNNLSISIGDGNSNPATLTKESGVYGRASDDLSYKMEAKGGNTGRNYFGANCNTLDTRVMEISFAHSKDSMDLCLSGAMYITNVASDYIDEAKTQTNRASGTFLTITKDSIVTSSHPAYASGWSGKKLADIEAEKWVNLAIVIPGSKQVGGATDKIYIYINGEEFEIPLKTPIYGTRHLRFSPAQELSTVKTVYIDNFRQYNGSTELYAKEKDALPVYDLSAVDYYETNINVSEGATVKELKDKIFTTAEIRVFKDDSYSEVLDDEDVLGRGNVVVFAANNRRVNERAYLYFTVNMPLSIKKINITNGDGKNIKGTTSDIKNSGEKYYLDATIENKASETEATLLAMVASYNEDGLLIGMDSKPVTVAPGTNVFAAGKKEVFFEGIDLELGGTLKAFLWMPDTNEPMCDNFETSLSGKEEYHILAFSNSYGNDAFSYICQIGKAVDIDIYAVNMYTGGCSLSKHYAYMNGSGTYQKRLEYTPNDGTITTENVSFEDGLNTYGYAWDYITLQSRSVEAYDFDYYYTEETPYLTSLADYIKTNSPKSELMMYQTWTLDTDTAKTSSYTKNIIADLEEDQIRPTLFGLLKNNYLRAAEMIGNPNRIVPVGEAINYALEELGFPQYVLNEDGSYNSSGASRGIYRDTTCHLATCGKLINAFTWYEYITGRDARENPYQLSDVSAEDMALIKEAAHYACTRPEYNPQ